MALGISIGTVHSIGKDIPQKEQNAHVLEDIRTKEIEIPIIFSKKDRKSVV